MAHQRKAIRDAVSVLLAGLPTTAARVFAGRVYNHGESELPCLRIYARHERIEYEDEQSPRTQKRTLTLEIRGIAKSSTSLEDDLDTIAGEVEDAMDVSEKIGGLVSSLDFIDTVLDASGEGNQPIGNVVTTYEAVYYTEEKAVAGPVNNFITFHAETQLDADAEPELVTEETLPQ